ncbi:hypothetical protein RHSIM_Rhsim02G0177500 [Rhododendron simsii]|uniref:Neprosin PEP catalytic domain-containing protein n=1 Tax=Rhododendron simsii TaxID=118357 RepID=A0A834LVF4_RHOSS|nr:hypothetical protein RHSIM_Rhsim02G0177500 [Rhododendron simsii]
MDLRVVLVLLFISSLLVCHNTVEGGTGLSEEEYLELEKQIELLNKPAVKTIHMKPTSLTRKARDEVALNGTKPTSTGALRGGGCPLGTVPIRRVTREDLIREKLDSKTMSLEENRPGTHYAVLRTRVTRKKFSGAGARFTLHRPHVNGGQYSAARVKIQNGPDSIESGWRVDPSLYGDSRTRGYIHFNAGQSHCFNTRCPGFVIVRSDVQLDAYFAPVSIPGIDPVSTPVYIIRDKPSGNWWLIIREGYIAVGFWPKRIFTGLGDLANYVEWGGEAFSPPGTVVPPMGTGFFPIRRFISLNAYFRRIVVRNEYGQTVDVDNTEAFADNNKLYGVVDKGDQGDYFGRVFLYGGPGGKT